MCNSSAPLNKNMYHESPLVDSYVFYLQYLVNFHVQVYLHSNIKSFYTFYRSDYNIILFQSNLLRDSFLYVLVESI